jgi:hypothetical protein
MVLRFNSRVTRSLAALFLLGIALGASHGWAQPVQHPPVSGLFATPLAASAVALNGHLRMERRFASFFGHRYLLRAVRHCSSEQDRSRVSGIYGLDLLCRSRLGRCWCAEATS